MKKILSEFLFGQFLCSTSLGCPFTSLWKAFFVNYWAACTFASTLLPKSYSQEAFLFNYWAACTFSNDMLPNNFFAEVLSGSCWTISVEA